MARPGAFSKYAIGLICACQPRARIGPLTTALQDSFAPRREAFAEVITDVLTRPAAPADLGGANFKLGCLDLEFCQADLDRLMSPTVMLASLEALCRGLSPEASPGC